jgi:hypothetical protein
MTTTNPTEDVLKRFEQTFADAEIIEDGVPDGKYQVIVEKAELTESQNGKPMLKMTLRVLGPDYEGQIMWRHNMLVTEDNIRWLKRDLHRCGLELEKLSDLPARLGDLLDVKLDVTKKIKDEFTNIYINKRLEVGEDGTVAGLPTF